MKKILWTVIITFTVYTNSLAVDMNGKLPFCKGTNIIKWSECAGTANYTNGDSYLGNFLNGKFHGRGMYTFKNGTTYIGDFKNGQINGKGGYDFFDGSKYFGEVKNGKFHGQGKYTNKNGQVLNSKFENGKAVKANQKNLDNKALKDTLVIPININIIQVKEKNFKTLTTEEHVRKEVQKINDIWKQANISFEIKKISKNKSNTLKFQEKWKWIKKNMPYTREENRKHEIASKIKGSEASNKDTEVLIAELNLINYEKNYRSGAINIFYLPQLLYNIRCGVSYNLSKMEKKIQTRHNNYKS